MLASLQEHIAAAILGRFPGLSAADLSFRPAQGTARGDVSLSTFLAAKRLGKSPTELASECSVLELPPGISAAISEGPYVNYRLDRRAFVQALCAATAEASYGSSSRGAQQPLLIEHTSINPNASPHLGRARNALVGDTLVRLLRFQGHPVEVHYYVNDMGKQIALLALECRALPALPHFDELLALYVKANERAEADPAFAQAGLQLLRQFEERDEATVQELQRLVDVCLAGQLTALQRLGIQYDVFDRESRFLHDAQLDSLITRLRSDGALFVDEDGREVVDLQKLGHAREEGRYFVLRRANGSSLYGYRDLAYTMYKLDRAGSASLIVLGEDHKLYFEQLQRILAVAGRAAPEVVHYSYIVLREGKMSTRKGTVVLLTDFLDEAARRARVLVDERSAALPETERAAIAEQVAVATIRFSILRVHPNRNVTFDWESALSFQGDSGPYIQYCCARIASILRKLEGWSPAPDAALAHPPEELAWALALQLAELEVRAANAAAKRNPAIIADYALDVAQAFNTFYHQFPVLDAETSAAKAFRSQLCRATLRVLTRSLALLGIEAPERM